MPGKDKVICPKEVTTAITNLRKSLVSTCYVVVGYSNKNTLTVVAEGEGTLETAKNEGPQNFPKNKCRYAIFKSSHKVELANTVKFAFVDWTPTTISPLRKGLLSIHKGQVRQIFHPYHVSLECSDIEDLDSNAIEDKISFSSGTAVHITKKGTKSTTAASTKGENMGNHIANDKYDEREKKHKKHRHFQVNTNGITASRKLRMEGDDLILSTVEKVRSDNDPTQWMLVTYKDDATTLTLKTKGTSSFSDMCSKLTDDEVFYGFFRIEENFDEKVKNTVKFGFFQLVCDKLPASFKGKLSTHRGFVTGIFNPFHEEFLISSKVDISEEIVRNRIRRTIGTDTSILTKSAADEWIPRETATTTSSFSSSHNSNALKKGGGGGGVKSKGKMKNGRRQKRRLKFSDKEKFDSMINAVRSDADSSTTWILAQYIAKSTITPVLSGNGGWKNLQNAIKETKNKCISFALLRVLDQIDNSSTIKFVYFKIQPKNISPMLKGFCNTQKGAIDSLFQPYHVDFFLNDPTEDGVNEKDIMDKVGCASGSKSHVVPNT
mmetsp:Transcript_19442/g.31673  ORF Transcript_19442/g.31673 Transcript_19442/m.31673 type:complete len:548 (-) Transcript_19442:314-1957(-)